MNATTPTRDPTPFAPVEHVRAQPVDRERLTASQRFGEVVALFVTGILVLLFFGFFAYHQATGTGFFTAKFGVWEAILFYIPMALSLAVPFTRALTGRRNPARLVEALTNVFQAFAAVWLLTVFPFNFAHLADALPGGIHAALAWVNNDIGRAVLIIQIVICPIVALVRAGQFVFYSLRESGYLPKA